MTNYGKIDFREPNIIDYSDPKLGPLLNDLKRKQYRPYIFELWMQQEAPDTNLAEIYVDFTNEFNGEGTSAYLYIIGTDAQDKAAGTGAQKVTLFGIDTDGNPNAVEETMHATAATEKASTNKWKRFIGAMVTAAGSGGKNADTIQITDTGQANVYGTIAANENCTIGTRIYVPANYNAFIAKLEAACKVAPHATAEVVYGTGAVVAPYYKKSSVTDLKPIQYWVNPDKGLEDVNIPLEIVEGANTYYLTIQHATKAADANDVGIYHLIIIMYGTTNTLRSLPS
jgi:hypothetical protein